MLHARTDYNDIQPAPGSTLQIPHNEPVFLLRAKDLVSADAVEAWCVLAEAAGALKNIVDTARIHAAINEVRLAGFCKTDSVYEGMVGEAVIELLRALGKQGHSGMSHGIVLSVFAKVAKGDCLTDLTCNPDEWVDHGGETRYQNKRCFNIFSKDLRTAYTLDGVVFEYKNGAGFTGNQSKVEFTLPGKPPETRRVTEEEWAADHALQLEFPGAFS